jgi:mannose-6-phosphate isomerase-like protein (cupin superfamily)
VATAGEAFVLAPGEGRKIDLGAFGMTVKAGRHETDGLFSLLEADEPPGFGPPLHIHHDAAEAFYVLEGEYVMFLDDRAVSCPAGSFIFVPAGCATASKSARRRVASSTSTSRPR